MPSKTIAKVDLILVTNFYWLTFCSMFALYIDCVTFKFKTCMTVLSILPCHLIQCRFLFPLNRWFFSNMVSLMWGSNCGQNTLDYTQGTCSNSSCLITKDNCSDDYYSLKIVIISSNIFVDAFSPFKILRLSGIRFRSLSDLEAIHMSLWRHQQNYLQSHLSSFLIQTWWFD
jgi:hypothetical protein